MPPLDRRGGGIERDRAVVVARIAIMAGQIDAHRRALPDLRIDAHLPARLAREAVDHRQAKARALAHRLGGVEGVEGARLHLGRHAGAGVGDAHGQILPGFEVAFARGALVEPAVGGLDRDPAALRHRVACVDAEVQDRVFELVGIDHRGPYARRADHLQRDAGADGALDEIAEIGDQPVDVGRLGIERLAARKGEQPVGQRCRAPRRAERRGGVAIEVADTPLRDAHLHHLDRARDAGEHVVEIVRQAAGELADRLHLLRLPQMRFGDHQRVRALLDLLFEAGGERAQFLLDAATLGRVAGAFGDVADEGDLVGQPGPGHGVVEVEQRDEIAPFGDRHVDEGHSGQALQPLGGVTGARVVVDVADRDRLAAL